MPGYFSRFITVALFTVFAKRRFITLALLTVAFATSSVAQSGAGHILYGDFRVDQSKVHGAKPLSFDLILYNGGRRAGRQTLVNNSHYRFMDLVNGDYDLVVEVEGTEVARIHVVLNEIFKTDIRQDIELEWRENLIGNKKNDTFTAAPVEIYERSSTN